MPPVIRQQNGQLSICIPLRQGADLAAVLVELVSSLSGTPNAAETPVNMTDGAAMIKVWTKLVFKLILGLHRIGQGRLISMGQASVCCIQRAVKVLLW